MIDESARRPIESADLLRLQSVEQVVLHPTDGSVVYSITWPDEASDANRSQLHLNRGPGSNRQLTYGHHDRSPRFSPDGTRLAFVRTASPTTPDEPTALMLLDWDRGRLHQAATFIDGIDEVHWVDDGRLAVLAPRRPADQVDVDDEELARRPRVITRADYRFNGRGWMHDRPRQVAMVTLHQQPGRPVEGATTWLDELVGEPGYPLDGVDHRALAVAPDGSRLAVIATAAPDSDITHANEVWVHPLDGTAPSRRITAPEGAWSGLTWHPEGPIVAVGSTECDHYGFARPHRLDPEAEGATVLGPHDLNAAPVIGARTPPVAVDGGVLIVQAQRGAMVIDRYDLASGALTPVVHQEAAVVGFDTTPDGSRLVAAITTVDRPAELWDASGPDPVRLAALNDDVLAELDLARTEAVEVEHPDGHTIHAFITTPPASAPPPSSGSTRPGLVYVHGGPMAQYGYSFFDEFQMAAALGFVVIGANPRGSDGYGEEWAQALIGRLGTVDWDDVQAVTDHLAARDDVDEGRVGIGGGSYGGFMASWAIGHTDRYQAALVERAVISWTSMFGTSDIGPQLAPRLLGATLETDPEAVRRQSPLEYASAIDTPTLILHSEHDWRCPIEQAEQLFVAIVGNGGDATLVRFPGEDHEMSRTGSPRHRVERFEIVHDFFVAHLKP